MKTLLFAVAMCMAGMACAGICVKDGETIAFTAPLFDRLSDTMPFLGSVYTTTEYAGQWLNMEWFEPLREREDFKALCAEMQPKEKI